jgi:DNA-binding transcriptional ArsR family regulator
VEPKGYIYLWNQKVSFYTMKRDVFQGIADPTRREIISMIAQKPLNVNSVAGNFDVSRTAIYKHVKILTECGLIVIKQHGRERYYEAKLAKLNEVSDWIDQYRKFWNAKLDSLEEYLNKLQAENKVTAKNKKNANRK